MRRTGILIICISAFLSLQAQHKSDFTNRPAIKFVALEVLQTSMYTYIQAKQDTSVYWLAIPRIEVNKGDTMYHFGGIEMPNFQSKELNRKFPVVYFMDLVSKDPEAAMKKSAEQTGKTTKPKPGKVDIKIDPPAGGISLADLFRDKENYAGKKVKIKGQVVRYNEKIMKKNWAHLQDGTSFGEDYDLTVTLDSSLNVGDTVSLEGVITLNKDFSSGYFFKIIMEDAVISK